MIPESLNASQIQAIKGGDRKLQNWLFNNSYSYCCGVAYRYCQRSEEVDHLASESLFKVLTKIEMYNEGASFKAWVRQITVRTVIDWLRKDNRISNNEADWDFQEMPMGPLEPLVNQMNALEMEDIQKVLASLPNNTRTVFNLYVFDGHTHKEIAELTGLSDGTSKWHLSQARKLLKDTITNLFGNMKTLVV